ncbi:hypothetical protein LZZ90_06270 [Flavobacterium sp. SM15]|uniref:hypothetical protein n=1 Tax=Flavobacterium sp. SM15 TaxID=2908005 RepID=UPI001EDB3DB6|nr:hypothetical protein [Flavobacterium sp. SM15]MCG2611106.1 hypothetical protein [Flavobacterium sp. SM15]
MKLLLVIIINLFISKIYSQNKIITTYDATKNTAIENVNFIFNEGTKYRSDKNGKVILKSIPSENLTITHIAYDSIPTKISFLRDTVFLNKKITKLNEILIPKKKIKIIYPKKSVANLNPRNYGTSAPLDEKSKYAVHIPNNLSVTFFIKSITLEPTDFTVAYFNENDKIKSKHYKNQKYAPFKLNLYTVDSVYGIPDQPIFENDFILKLEDGKKYVTLKLDNQIEINNTGFFIVLSPLSKEEYENLAFERAPAFKHIQANKDIEYKVLTKNERVDYSIWKQTQRSKDYNQVLYFELEIEY